MWIQNGAPSWTLRSFMEVERADETWLEDVRLRRWVGGKKALRLIGRPELREMLRRGMRRLSGGNGPIA